MKTAREILEKFYVAKRAEVTTLNVKIEATDKALEELREIILSKKEINKIVDDATNEECIDIGYIATILHKKAMEILK